MGKKTISIFFAIFLLISIPISVNAYEISGFDITAKSALLVSLDTGEVIFSKNPDEKAYPASITKIMTGILILESDKYVPEGKVTMTKEIRDIVLGTGLSVSNLKAGEEITQFDLLNLILISSYGDCAYLAAQYYGGSIEAFVETMNQKAALLKMVNTSYGNPVGLHDAFTYTTATDVYRLASYAYSNAAFKEICSKSRHTIPATNMSAARTISTTVLLQDNTTGYYYSPAKGIKTGFTDQAGRCLVSTATYNGYNYMTVLLGCPNNTANRHEFVDSKNLYKWAFNNFEYKEIADTANPVKEMPVTLSWDTDFIPLYIEKSFISILPKEANASTIVMNFNLKSESVEAPVKKGQVLGTVDIVYAENIIGTVNLVAGNDVKRSKILSAIKSVKSVFTSSVVKMIGIIGVCLVIVFIIATILLNVGRGKKRKVKYIPYEKDDK